MALYNNTNLIKYEDTIRLHFDVTGKTAWLTLTNYGVVFGKGNEDASKVFTVTVGLPAKEGGELPLALDDRRLLEGLGFKGRNFKPCAETISIGALLDATDVVKLQGKILEQSCLKTKSKVLSRSELINLIGTALGRVYGRGDFFMLHKEHEPGFVKYTRDYMERNWFTASGPETSKAVREYGPATVGFTAYLPNPGLIAEEERTLRIGDKGKTDNNDTRAIDPIPSGMMHAVGPKPQEGLAKGTWELEWIVNDIDTDIKKEYYGKVGMVGKEITDEPQGRIHAQIARISCFGFRGDDRNPQQLKAAGGFLPGVTRRDAKYMLAHGKAAGEIDRTLPYLPTERIDEPLTPERERPFKRVLYDKPKHGADLNSNDISPELEDYIGKLKYRNVMHLGVYTEMQDFKGYISATKSTAIAKHFSNGWRDEVELITYCYVVRCRGGFHLQSTVLDAGIAGRKAAKEYLKELHEFNSYAEQEVAVAGAIWWEDVVGMRIIRCDQGGQFFFGPVFLRADLMWADNAAFSALFELLSGKSQGEAPGVIEKSYDARPFEFLSEDLTTKGANAILPAIAVQSPLVSLNPGALTFGQQPVGSESTPQILTLINLGNEALVLQSLLISGSDSKDFVVFAHGEGFRTTYSVTFKPRPPLKPSTGRVDKSKTKYEMDERTATINFTHNLAGSPHHVNLKGYAAPALKAWQLSSAEIDFGQQALDTASVPKMFTLSLNSPQPVPIEVLQTPSTSEFSIAGDYKRFDEEKQIEVRALHNTYTFYVTFSPKAVGKSSSQFKIFCEGNPEPIVVEVSGVGTKRNVKYKLSSESLDFGRQALNSTSDPKTGVLKNIGNVPIEIDFVTVVGADASAFVCERDSEAVVEPGKEGRILIRFCPTKRAPKDEAERARKYEAELFIGSNNTLLRIMIKLSGKAAET